MSKEKELHELTENEVFQMAEEALIGEFLDTGLKGLRRSFGYQTNFIQRYYFAVKQEQEKRLIMTPPITPKVKPVVLIKAGDYIDLMPQEPLFEVKPRHAMVTCVNSVFTDINKAVCANVTVRFYREGLKTLNLKRDTFVETHDVFLENDFLVTHRVS